MLLLCLSWGFNQVAVKLALPDIPPMLQAMIRSSGAILVLLLIAPLALLAANLLAAWPARRAARLRTGQILRTE